MFVLSLADSAVRVCVFVRPPFPSCPVREPVSQINTSVRDHRIEGNVLLLRSGRSIELCAGSPMTYSEGQRTREGAVPWAGELPVDTPHALIV